MIEEIAVVEAIKDNGILIRTQRQSACNTCSANKGCGTKLLNQISEDGQQWLASVRKSDLKLSVGDQVVIGLDESALTQGSALVYGLPMLLMICLAGSATSLGAGDALVAVLAFVGLFLGFGLARLRSNQVASRERYQPVILRRVIPLIAS